MGSNVEYKGYRGSVKFAGDDRVLHGKILGIEDLVTFEATSVSRLEKAFRDAVDDYIEVCAEIGKTPERAYSGKTPLRIAADLHRQLAIEAEIQGQSLNALIAAKLSA